MSDPETWQLDDIVAVAELADELDVSRGIFSNWAKKYPSFPQPLRVLRCGSLYSRRQVLAWVVQNKPQIMLRMQNT